MAPGASPRLLPREYVNPPNVRHSGLSQAKGKSHPASQPPTEDFPEQFCRLRGWIFTDSLFFLAELVKQAVQGFPDHICIKIKVLHGAEAGDGWTLHNGVVLSDHTDF